MRGREFLMKDGYNFDLTTDDAQHAYNRHMVPTSGYERMGLKAIPMRADTGPIGGDYTHEFLVLARPGRARSFMTSPIESLGPRSTTPIAGEVSQIVVTWTAPYTGTEERHDPGLRAVPEARRVEGRGIEVGQIFYFGTKYSEPMKALVMGGRASGCRCTWARTALGSCLVGAIVEASHDDKGIVWPEASPRSRSASST